LISWDLNYRDYYYDNNLDELLNYEYKKAELYSPGYVFDIDGKDPFMPDCDDLIRLHYIIRSRKVMTVLELGVGWSTIIMADALHKNRMDYFDQIKDTLRRVDPFTIYTVDTEKKYVDITKKNLPKKLKKHVQFFTTSAYLTTFNERICGRLKKIPNICPDFIYSDGPSFRSINGEINGVKMDHQDRTIITADLISIEPFLLPGTLILFDGQTNNARFHKNNFQRSWEYKHFKKEDLSVFELCESPLGPYNELQLKFQNIN
jgi:hypothetical protein